MRVCDGLKIGCWLVLTVLTCQWMLSPWAEARGHGHAARIVKSSHRYSKVKTSRQKAKPTKKPVKSAYKKKSVTHAKTAVKASAHPKAVAIPVQTSSTLSDGRSQLSSGVRFTRFTQRLNSGPVRISLLEIDPKTSGLEIMPVLASGRMGSKTNVANMVSNHQAVAGINGSFFKPDVGIPLGILMINQELISGPIYDRVALGITANNDLVMDRVHLGGEIVLPSGHRVLLHNVNQPRVNPTTNVIYSSRWGQHAPKVPSNGVQVLLRNGHVAAISTTAPLDIPRDGIVVSGSYTPEMSELASLGANQSVQMNVYTLPDWSGMRHAIGGGPWLVKEGQSFVDLKSQHFGTSGLGHREPRSAVGITQDGKMLLVAVDGRRPGASVGMTLYELSHLMRSLGAVQAMNLDGGSSTQMAVYGKVVNVPSSGQIGVSNSLIVRQANRDNMASREEEKRF